MMGPQCWASGNFARLNEGRGLGFFEEARWSHERAGEDACSSGFAGFGQSEASRLLLLTKTGRVMDA